MIIEFVDKETPIGGRSSIQLIAVKGKEAFYEKIGFHRNVLCPSPLPE